MNLALCILLFVVCACVDSSVIGREKRLFKSSVADRIGHGFGKRQESIHEKFYPSENSRNLMTTHRLARLLSQNNLLAYTIVEKFVDRNGDGLISTDELLFDKMDQS